MLTVFLRLSVEPVLFSTVLIRGFYVIKSTLPEEKQMKCACHTPCHRETGIVHTRALPILYLQCVLFVLCILHTKHTLNLVHTVHYRDIVQTAHYVHIKHLNILYNPSTSGLFWPLTKKKGLLANMEPGPGKVVQTFGTVHPY
jgi:hypothetical protein